MSFDIDTDEDEEGQQPAGPEGDDGTPLKAGSSQVSVTDLALHKVPVVRVEGAFVRPTLQASDDKDTKGEADDRIFVTLAIEPDDAARVIFAAEWGSIWLSLEPEGAPDDRVPTVVISLPERGQAVLQ